MIWNQPPSREKAKHSMCECLCVFVLFLVAVVAALVISHGSPQVGELNDPEMERLIHQAQAQIQYPWKTRHTLAVQLHLFLVGLIVASGVLLVMTVVTGIL